METFSITYLIEVLHPRLVESKQGTTLETTGRIRGLWRLLGGSGDLVSKDIKYPNWGYK